MTASLDVDELEYSEAYIWRLIAGQAPLDYPVGSRKMTDFNLKMEAGTWRSHVNDITTCSV